MRAFLRRLWRIANRRRFERELADEMAFHREMLDREGRSDFGAALRLREESRDAWGWTWLDRLGQDLKYGARILRRAPGFTGTAVMVLALGIGVNISAFQLLNMMVLKPLPVRDPHSLVRFERRHPGGHASNVQTPAMLFYRDNNTVLSAVLAHVGADLRFGDDPSDRPSARFVTGNYFTELGTRPAYGRMLGPDDEAPGAPLVVVLDYRFWERRLGSDPSIVGRTVRLNGKPVTVAGIGPYDLITVEPGDFDLWLPLAQYSALFEGSKILTDYSTGVEMYGRLKPGISPEAAEAALKPLVAAQAAAQPDHFFKGEYLDSLPGGRIAEMNEGAIPIMALSGGLVLLVLAVACANLGSLLLARGVVRERELAIRAAVGAGRGRVVRQLLTESFLLALMGSAAGLAMSIVAVKALFAVTGTRVFMEPSADWRVLLFTFAMAVVASVAFGLTPALQIARQRHRATRARLVMVAMQVAASCVLLIVSALLVRSLRYGLSIDPGFEYKNVIALNPQLELFGFKAEGATAYWDQLKRRVGALPGVESISLVLNPPLGGRRSVENMREAGVQSFANYIDPEYFRTMGIPILRGRLFTAADRDAVIVSESLAAKLWPNGDAVGKQYRPGSRKTVIGVAGSARTIALRDVRAVESYYPAPPDELPQMTLLVRTTGPPAALVEPLRAAAQGVDPRVSPGITLLDAAFRDLATGGEAAAIIVGSLGLIALALATIGIAGLIAFVVAQRTREIGVRLALGAGPADVLGAVLGQLLRPVLWGAAFGMAGAFGLSMVLRRELYGLSSIDPVSYGSALTLFVVVAGGTGLLPASRALRVAPSEALRHE